LAAVGFSIRGAKVTPFSSEAGQLVEGEGHAVGTEAPVGQSFGGLVFNKPPGPTDDSARVVVARATTGTNGLLVPA